MAVIEISITRIQNCTVPSYMADKHNVTTKLIVKILVAIQLEEL